MFHRALLILLLTVPAFAAERTHTVVPEDYFSLAAITEVGVSPDGKQVAFAEARWSKDDDSRKSDLWVIATDGNSKPVRLTFDRANDRQLKWSADGKTIYFLGNRKRAAETKAPYDGKTQVWAISATGGDPRPVTKEAEGVDHYDYAAKANTLFYSVQKPHHDDDAFKSLREKFKLDYGHGVRKVSEIHGLNLDDWRDETVYDEKRYVREFAATADGKRLAMVTAFDDSVLKSEGESRVDVWEAGKTVTPPMDVYRAKAASPHAWLENLCWNPDGTKFAFNAVFDGYPAEMIVGTYSPGGWNTAKMPRGDSIQVTGYGRGTGQPLHWLDNNRIAFLAERNGLGLIALFDGKDTLAPKEPRGHVYGFDPMPDGSFTAIGAPRGEVAQLAVINPTKGWSLLHHPNPQCAEWKTPSVKHVTWKAADGSEVGGVLELPPGHGGKSKLPLVVGIHGGPTTSAKNAIEFDPHNGRMYFATAGYAVLFPNYRGSTGYGDKFTTDLIGHENDVEVNDIIAGVMHLVKEGIVDPDRVAVMGWSNGGYLTNCLITRKDLPFKLKAASSGAGIVDIVAEWGFNDEPAYPEVFKKGHPWETPDLYRKASPTYDLGNIKTPTLIHVGGHDERCPPGHSRMLHRALKEYLNVPTELCEYPGEPHGLTKMTHRRAKMEWDLAWFEKYLK
ncbi:MAG: prolyl oligopeptidase family serine peptidase [Gemmataceae bacterium]